MKGEVIALMDGDIFAYNAAAATEVEVEWEEGIWTLHTDMDRCVQSASSRINSTAESIGADRVVFVWSCPTRRYWRHDIFPGYKGNRKQFGARAPLALMPLKELLAGLYESYMEPNLEGDDVLGVLATAPWYEPDAKKVMVSIDKDMKTVPGWIYNPDKDLEPWLQTELGADLFLNSQAIGGDSTDGYKGCAGMSQESGRAFLKDPYEWESYQHEFKSGARKGMSEQRWRKVEPSSLYGGTISLFMKGAGLSEADAIEEHLRNWQCARILRDCDYDWETKTVTMLNN